MDEMIIRTKATKGLIAFLIKQFIRSKLGIDAAIRFPGNIELKIDGGAHLAFNVEADISEEDYAKLRNKLLGLQD